MGLFYIVLFIVGVWLIVKMLRSRWWDNLFNDLAEGKLEDDAPKEVMKDIAKAETNLGKQAKENLKEAEKLTKESDNVNEFLDNRGVGQVKKEEGQ